MCVTLISCYNWDSLRVVIIIISVGVVSIPLG